MNKLNEIHELLKDVESGRLITRKESVELLKLPENSIEAAHLRSVANIVTRKRFNNKALMLGQIGIDREPCDGDCAFCFFAKSFTKIKPSMLEFDEIKSRCDGFIAGGAAGVFLMTMHRFGFDWFRDMCHSLKQ